MIKTPPGWGTDVVSRAYQSMTRVGPEWTETAPGMPAVRRIHIADLRWALARGLEDFGSSRTDLIFLCVIYPLLGLLLARVASGYGLMPLVFPLASGFALIGPLAAVGLNEMSRRREQGLSAGLADAFSVFRSPAIGGVLMLGAVLIVMFLCWLVASSVIYNLTLGPEVPASVGGFVHDVVFTRPGRLMAAMGIGTGFVLAVVALTISVVSFPLLLDRNVSLETAVRTSMTVVMRNPLTMAAWGGIIAAGLVIGSIPLLLGLVFVMPVLGHATWHLYRRAVAR
ncbi:DUF2189 domain-containing protein [Rhodopila sp.]|uniref:DUF2189 domain-containing protein n=1 Tax=Rhodopila sp. TaxID=2480087 RepID=UPI003D0CC8FE